MINISVLDLWPLHTEVFYWQTARTTLSALTYITLWPRRPARAGRAWETCVIPVESHTGPSWRMIPPRVWFQLLNSISGKWNFKSKANEGSSPIPKIVSKFINKKKKFVFWRKVRIPTCTVQYWLDCSWTVIHDTLYEHTDQHFRVPYARGSCYTNAQWSSSIF